MKVPSLAFFTHESESGLFQSFFNHFFKFCLHWQVFHHGEGQREDTYRLNVTADPDDTFAKVRE